jgi:hypothetical protein
MMYLAPLLGLLLFPVGLVLVGPIFALVWVPSIFLLLRKFDS